MHLLYIKNDVIKVTLMNYDSPDEYILLIFCVFVRKFNFSELMSRWDCMDGYFIHVSPHKNPHISSITRLASASALEEEPAGIKPN